MALFHQNHDTTMSILDVLKDAEGDLLFCHWLIHHVGNPLGFFRLKQVQEFCDVVICLL